VANRPIATFYEDFHVWYYGLMVLFMIGVDNRDAYNGISNPMDLNSSMFESKNQSFFEDFDLKKILIKQT